GEREADLALGLGLDRARVDLAVGHVVPPVRGLPAAAVDNDPQVRVRPDNSELVCASQLTGAPGELLLGRLPVCDRIAVALDVAGAVDETLVVVQRHPRVLRVRRRRKEHPGPAQLARGDSLPAADRQLPAGRTQALVP